MLGVGCWFFFTSTQNPTPLLNSALRRSTFIEWYDYLASHVAVSRGVEGDCEAVFVRADARRAEVLTVADGEGRLQPERVGAPAAAFEQETERARARRTKRTLAPGAGGSKVL